MAEYGLPEYRCCRERQPYQVVLPEEVKNKTFFITGTPKDSCDKDYQDIAKKFDIPWGGYI